MWVPVANQRGVTYLSMMFVIVVLGITLMAIGRQWSVTVTRDREQELLFRGNRIKAAIEAYAADYQVKKAFRANVYPLTLTQLTEGPKRYLQVAYKDPMTGRDFDLIKVSGQIQGVRSRGKGTPLDQVHFKGAKTYAEVAFQAASNQAQPCLPSVNPLNPLLTTPCPPATGGSPVQAPGQPPGTPGTLPATPAP